MFDTDTNELVTRVQADGGSIGIAITPDGKRAYVTHDSGALSVLNTSTNTVVTKVSVGSQKAGIAITPDGKHAYAADFGSNTILVLDTATNMVEATISLNMQGPGHPFGIAIAPDGKHAYVTSTGGHVSVLDTATATQLGVVGGSTIPSGAGIAITPLPISAASPSATSR